MKKKEKRKAFYLPSYTLLLCTSILSRPTLLQFFFPSFLLPSFNILPFLWYCVPRRKTINKVKSHSSKVQTIGWETYNQMQWSGVLGGKEVCTDRSIGVIMGMGGFWVMYKVYYDDAMTTTMTFTIWNYNYYDEEDLDVVKGKTKTKLLFALFSCVWGYIVLLRIMRIFQSLFGYILCWFRENNIKQHKSHTD